MKCPNCGYKHGWDAAKFKDVRGKYGCFYENAVKMEQHVPCKEMNRKELYACPKCGIAFIYTDNGGN